MPVYNANPRLPSGWGKLLNTFRGVIQPHIDHARLHINIVDKNHASCGFPSLLRLLLLFRSSSINYFTKTLVN